MPFKSKAQRRWMYSQKPEMARRWEKHTPKARKASLPERVTSNSRRVTIDPTRSTTLRRVFQSAMSKRFRILNKRIRDLLLVEKAFGEGEIVGNHEYASTQVNLHADKGIAEQIRQIQGKISKDDLLKVEPEPHVTILYGLHNEDPEPVKKLLEKSGPVWIKLGRLALFSSEKQDVLKIDVISSRLEDLNRRLKILPNTQSFSGYQPHLTVAYLKPGTGEKYLKLITGLEGTEVISTKMVFSDKNREHVSIVLNTRWQYQTSLQKLQAFRLWLQDQMKAVITSEDLWWQSYIEDGYRKGAKRAFDDVTKSLPDLDKPIGPWYQGTKMDFLSGSFGRVVPVEKVKLLASRVFSDLDGITDFMETRIVRALTDGLTQGQHPQQIAGEMSKTVSIGLGRAKTIAQTEIIRAHAEGQLDALEKLGVDQVGVTVEWSTAGDNRVCKLCQPLNNIVLTTKEARGIIPRHPRCRCSFKPAGMIDRRGTQVKKKNQIEAAIAKSLDAENPRTKRSMGRSRDLNRWIGSKIKIAKTRPQSPIG